MNKLLPCPKCNDSCLFESVYDYGSDYENLGYHGTCKCGQFDRSVSWSKTKEQAIEEWNLLIQERINKEEGKTCIHCLNSEPYVCDIIWCSEWKKPTHKQETCEKFRRSL